MPPVVSAKSALRAELLRARLQLSPSQRADLDSHLLARVEQLLEPGMTVAAYHPLPSEPGGSALVDVLSDHCAAVYLPISLADGNLAWSLYTGPTSSASGPLGICEPQGPRHDSSVLASCDFVFTPAMAVHPSGFRLGKGAGYYDRALAQLPEGATTVIALVYSFEVRPDVPVEAHDVAVEYILTEKGLRRVDHLA